MNNLIRIGQVSAIPSQEKINFVKRCQSQMVSIAEF